MEVSQYIEKPALDVQQIHSDISGKKYFMNMPMVLGLPGVALA